MKKKYRSNNIYKRIDARIRQRKRGDIAIFQVDLKLTRCFSLEVEAKSKQEIRDLIVHLSDIIEADSYSDVKENDFMWQYKGYNAKVLDASLMDEYIDYTITPNPVDLTDIIKEENKNDNPSTK
jgi:hypothetical protein